MTRLLNVFQLRGRFERRAVHVAAEALSWLVVGAGFELLGRHAPTDWVDLLAGAVLLGVAVAAAGPPFRFRLPRLALVVVRRAGQRLEALFDAHYGADFHPERPPHLPRLRRYRRVILVLGLADLAAGGAVALWGSPLLAALHSSYLLYLGLGAFVWASLAVTLASLSLTLLQQLRLALARARPRLDRRRLAALWLGLAAATAAFVQLDAWLGAAGWLAALALALLALVPPRFGPAVEFHLNLRVRQAGGPPRLETTTVEEMVRSFLAILALVALLLGLVLQGHRLWFAPPAPEMAIRLPLAHYAGRAAAWFLAAGTLFSTFLYLHEFTLRRRRSDPAFPGPVASEGERERVLELVRANLDLARAGRRDRGEGFLFAPHWWPSDRMYRDSWHEDDLSEGSAGPDFQRHYGQPARRLLRRLLRALAIDLVYIEDGVPSALLPRVFAALFRHYDARGGDQGGQRAQVLGERDLAAPPGVHLALQEIELDVPGRRLGAYKEPSYESLSRARVLLVLRVRGGEEEEAEDGDPFAWSREPGWVDRFLSRLPAGPGVPVG